MVFILTLLAFVLYVCCRWRWWRGRREQLY
jgi:hypothetical protein